ncbi:MAG: type II secretion system F family protein, partial [Proteobacteria bacterium]|nr:type II secretion system F family protein [Pseudomonadota bacterium]
FGPIKIVQDGKGGSQIIIGSGAPSIRDLVIFTKQFATMLSSGVPLIQTINVLGSQQKNRVFGAVLRRVQNDVENGKTLSEAMRLHKSSFDSLYIAMVRAGETSGSLDQILLRLTTYIEKAAKIKSQVKSAMVYPAIVVVAATSVISVLLAFVVPTFAKQFRDSGRDLPALTQIVVDFSDFFRLKNSQFDRIILYIPVLGDLIRKVAVGRFCSTLSTMLKAGVNLLEALSICAASAGNKRIEEFILYVRAEIEQGVKFSTPLAKDGLFPAMVVSMVEVGEATGALDDMLFKVAEFYEEEVDVAVKTLLSMIEPIMIVTIGSVVGFIVIAMYLPVFDMAGTVGG